MDYVNSFIADNKYKTLLEVGCGSSGWLPYFAARYNLIVSGLDYSEVGCGICEKNLRMQGIVFGKIFCRDLFDENCTDNEKYDVVFTYGVIEHFEDPGKVISRLTHLVNPGGLIISHVPNLNGLMGLMSRSFVREIHLMHRVVTREQLCNWHIERGLINLRTDYAGIFSLSVIPWVRSKTWFFLEKSFQRKVCLKLITIVESFLGKVFMRFLGKFTSKTFSPYIISICRKK
jgi:2-polyprenyl-6-hydroxyphenyl methylase/3-demethylubiquinone-9 3-methyltransferase